MSTLRESADGPMILRGGEERVMLEGEEEGEGRKKWRGAERERERERE